MNAVVTGPSSAADNVRASLYMVLGMACFAVNDLTMKAFGETLSLGQAVLIRGLFATALIYVIARARHVDAPFDALRSPMVLVRTLGEVIATIGFVTALWQMPLANLSAILQILPLTVTLGAALLWREAIGGARLVAILAGLAGVLLIIRPDAAGFGAPAAWALFAVFGCTLRDLATRRLHADLPSLSVTFAAALAVTLFGAVLSLAQPWQPVGGLALAGLAFNAVALIGGYHFLVLTMRTGEIAAVAPFRYTVLLFSMLGALLIYGEVPDALTLVGAAVIAGAGIVTLLRERMPAPARL